MKCLKTIKSEVYFEALGLPTFRQAYIPFMGNTNLFKFKANEETSS